MSIDFNSVRTNLTDVSAMLCGITNATPADTTIFGDVRLRGRGLETEVLTQCCRLFCLAVALEIETDILYAGVHG